MEQLEQEPSVDEQTARLRQLVTMASYLLALSIANKYRELRFYAADTGRGVTGDRE
jgi:hypothetical protein